MTLHLLRMREVAARIAYSESKVYAMIRDGDFPRGRKMPMGGVRWSSEVVEAWIRKTYAESEKASL
ncbi:helix-turn-helix transcriptional regulator [Vreelandella nigrificans]|uniref:AlpA family transcriptional regulator n=1 Tax=Vreelandella nigrificans TaxID=2042704 RepID=A0A2A4HUA8_9GAMM|nr:AlpA family phage regulatory protein [Halomonas nigrificans]PCF97654.1 AlpA family transcriptional regulator [Halomonas nigrificans]